jgi:hypothetical protein
MQSPGVVGERQTLSSPANMIAVSISDSDARAALLHAGKHKCGDCRHPMLLHFNHKCSMCACVAKPRPGNWKPTNVKDVYNAVIEGSKYHPDGIRLSELVFIVSRHNRKVHNYFWITKFGRKVSHMRHPVYGYLENTRYYRFRTMILNGKFPELSIKDAEVFVPKLVVYYNGDGFE